jgi:hypothetical protein
MTRGRVWVLVWILVLTAGCSTTATPTPITDLNEIAGSWNGWTKTAGGGEFRVNLLVQVDGQYRMIIERSHVYYGRLIRDGSGLRFRHGTDNWAGTVTLLEEPGLEYLRFVVDSGALWMQFERPR